MDEIKEWFFTLLTKNIFAIQTYLSFCLVNCVWGTWDSWATCSKTCGGGVQVRTRKVDSHEENGGTACSVSSTEQQSCNTATCPAGMKMASILD